MKAYFYLSTKRINSKGLAPVYCRIASQNDRADFSTGIFVPVEIWEQCPWAGIQYQKTGERLAIIINNVYKAIASCERENAATPANAVDLYRGNRNKPVEIADIATEYLRTVKTGLRMYTRINRSVQRFSELTGITTASKVQLDTIAVFQSAWMARLSPHSYVKQIQHLKRVFAYAKNMGYIQTNPFSFYRTPQAPKISLVYLSSQELQTLEEKRFKARRLNEVKDLFLFQCYTGLSYADLQHFGSNSIQQYSNRLFMDGKRQKTSEDFIVPFLPQAAAIADKYNYRLPVLSNQKYNAYLKEIADITGINKNLTTHVGRKTFAQVMIDSGYSMEAVSRMIGHSSSRMTEKHYARVGKARVINEVLRKAA